MQPDTIVPEPVNPQDLNRFSYTRNNPLRYRDPSGHCIVGYSGGGVRMDEAPYGTGGVCPNTESAIAEEEHAIEEYRNDPDNASSSQEHLFWISVSIAFPAVVIVGPAMLLPAIIEGATVTTSAACADTECTNEIQEVNTGIYVVYRLVENGVTRYVGITNDFGRRAAEHLGQRGWQVERIPSLDRLSREDARAVEQVFIQIYGLSNLHNRINSIAATNDIYSQAVRTLVSAKTLDIKSIITPKPIKFSASVDIIPHFSKLH